MPATDATMVAITGFTAPDEVLVGRRLEGSMTLQTKQKFEGRFVARLRDQFNQVIFEDFASRSFADQQTLDWRVHTVDQARGVYHLVMEIQDTAENVLAATESFVQLTFPTQLLAVELEQPGVTMGEPIVARVWYGGRQTAVLSIDLLRQPRQGWHVSKKDVKFGDPPNLFRIPTESIRPGVYYLRATVTTTTFGDPQTHDRVVIPISIFPEDVSL